MGLQEKVGIITGGATGIGAATAQRFAADGAVVYVFDIKPLSYDCDKVKLIQCDVTDFAQVERAVSAVVDQHGRIDWLFANAGIHRSGNIEETSLEVFEEVLSTNLRGIFYALKTVLPIMREQEKGNIVLTGSDQCFVAKPKNAAYVLTKGAIGQLTKNVAIDYAHHNIRINCVCPGIVDTPLLEGVMANVAKQFQQSLEETRHMFAEQQPQKRIGKAEEVAELIAFLCSDRCPFMTGALVSVDGGYVAQ